MAETKELQINQKELAKKLTAVRASVLRKYPFYGNLLMNLKFAFANCKTAATDMKRIIWDTQWLSKLTEDETEFVMLHEVLHCCLAHCTRGKSYQKYFYNVACDIVVNSMILRAMGKTDFVLDNEEVMHLAPDGKEGAEHTAEEVYQMLLKKYHKLIDDVDKLLNDLQNDYGVTLDQHDIWDMIPIEPILPEKWKKAIKEAVKTCGDNVDVPSQIRDILKDAKYKKQLDWKQLLHDFINIIHDRYDFSFSPADRRFSDSPYIIPSFQEMDDEEVNNLWFVVDASGSIDADSLNHIFFEIKSAVEEFAKMSAKISFFDTKVSEPQPFEDVESLLSVEAVGGGGTNFHAIFRYMSDHMIEDLPTAVIVLTDGYATYPPQDLALSVPVLWILINNDRNAPWGFSTHIEDET